MNQWPFFKAKSQKFGAGELMKFDRKNETAGRMNKEKKNQFSPLQIFILKM